MQEIEWAIREYLATHTGRDDVRTLGANESLLESGIIDSATMVGLISFIEEQYGFAVDEEDMVPENFETLAAIARYISESRSARP